MYRWIVSLGVLVSGGCGPVLGGWTTNLYGTHGFVALSESRAVQESSGVVASRVNADVYWTHNDSGSPSPRVYAFRLADSDRSAHLAKDLGSVLLTGASNLDWEDIAMGPGNKIYIFDGGDNPPCERANKRIHRCDEPVVDPNAAPINLTAGFESIRFEYPSGTDAAQPTASNDDRYDAECMMVHPASGDIYVVTKRNNADHTMAKVYKLAATAITWNSDQVHVLKFVADISSRVPHMTTAGDINVDGLHMVIRNYWSAYEFIIEPGEPFDKIFEQYPHDYPLLLEAAQLMQGEGICYGVFNGDLITTTEGRGDAQFSIFAVSWLLANTRAEQTGDRSAIVRWDTRKPADSRVDYGTSAWYGKTRSASGTAKSHAVTLNGLTAGKRYYYRVRSGDLTYPREKDAAKVRFLAGQRPKAATDAFDEFELASLRTPDLRQLVRSVRPDGLQP